MIEKTQIDIQALRHSLDLAASSLKAGRENLSKKFLRSMQDYLNAKIYPCGWISQESLWNGNGN